ncbi:uncharacterized protein [Drosophila kikkawai]|uniref:Uncharacterized protein n=1 Tax=Drosophila kikkawai TaxID=30033 RepID=A0ABM4GB25_DROKI
MSSSAYISNGIGINYYTYAYMPQVAVTSSSSVTASPAHQQQQQIPLAGGSSNSGSGSSIGAVGGGGAIGAGVGYPPNDPGLRRRLFAGIRPLSVFGRLRQQRSSQHRSISLPESNNYETPEHHSNCSGDSHSYSHRNHRDRSFVIHSRSTHRSISQPALAPSPSSNEAMTRLWRGVVVVMSSFLYSFDTHSTSMFRLCSVSVFCVSFLNFIYRFRHLYLSDCVRVFVF